MTGSPDGAGRADRPDRLDRPVPYRLVDRWVSTAAGDVVTLRVEPLEGPLFDFAPAQFSMIGVAGVGEVPISISSSASDRAGHEYTIRRAGSVTGALLDREVGQLVTVRGPFGRPWDLRTGRHRRALFVAGGIGLAPLRAAILHVVADRGPDAVTVLVGARTPADVPFAAWLDDLAAVGVDVGLTVDVAPDGSWPGRVGLVTELLAGDRAADAAANDAFVCGPDVMMVATTRRLVELGAPPDRIQLTLERNMSCGAGWCGHCQLGPLLVCRDGPVVDARRLGDLLERSEL